jgi:hypothetical protein
MSVLRRASQDAGGRGSPRGYLGQTSASEQREASARHGERAGAGLDSQERNPQTPPRSVTHPRSSLSLSRARRDRVPYSRSNCWRRPRPPSSKKDLKARVVGLTIGCRDGGPSPARGPRVVPEVPFASLGVRRQRYRRHSICFRRSAASLPSWASRWLPQVS